MGLKVAVGLIILGTICYDGQFYLRRSKIRGFLGVSAEFTLEKWSTPKIEILQYLDLGLLLEAEILLKYGHLNIFI